MKKGLRVILLALLVCSLFWSAEAKISILVQLFIFNASDWSFKGRKILRQVILAESS